MLCHCLIPLTSINFLPGLFRATASSLLDGTKKKSRCFKPTDLALEENVEPAGEVKDCDKYSCISLAFLMVAVRRITACVTFWYLRNVEILGLDFVLLPTIIPFGIIMHTNYMVDWQVPE